MVRCVLSTSLLAGRAQFLNAKRFLSVSAAIMLFLGVMVVPRDVYGEEFEITLPFDSAEADVVVHLPAWSPKTGKRWLENQECWRVAGEMKEILKAELIGRGVRVPKELAKVPTKENPEVSSRPGLIVTVDILEFPETCHGADGSVRELLAVRVEAKWIMRVKLVDRPRIELSPFWKGATIWDRDVFYVIERKDLIDSLLSWTTFLGEEIPGPDCPEWGKCRWLPRKDQ